MNFRTSLHRPLVAVVLGTALLAPLAPATAFADPGSCPPTANWIGDQTAPAAGSSTILVSAPAAAELGNSFTVSAAVVGASGPVAGVSATLYTDSYNNVGFPTEQGTSAVTDDCGQVKFTLDENAPRSLGVKFDGTTELSASRSAVRVVAAQQLTRVNLDAITPTSPRGVITGTIDQVVAPGSAFPTVGPVVQLWTSPDNVNWTLSETQTVPADSADAMPSPENTHFTFTPSPGATGFAQVRFPEMQGAAGVSGLVLEASSSESIQLPLVSYRTTTTTLKIPATYTYGASSPVSADVTWAGTSKPVVGASVTLQVVGGGLRYAVGPVVTDADGRARFYVTLKANSKFTATTAQGTLIAGDTTTESVSTVSAAISRPAIATLYAPTSTVSGERARLKATLLFQNSETPAEGETVELWEGQAGKAQVKIATQVIDMNGEAEFSPAPTSNAVYRLVYKGTAYSTRLDLGIPAVNSQVASVGVASKMTLTVPKSFKKKKSTKVSGTVLPKVSKAKVTLYAGTKKLTTVKTDSKGKFSAKIKLSSSTTLTARVGATKINGEGVIAVPVSVY